MFRKAIKSGVARGKETQIAAKVERVQASEGGLTRNLSLTHIYI